MADRIADTQTLRCPNCEAGVGDQERFCHGCGEPLRIKCTFCDLEAFASRLFCARCGVSYEKAEEVLDLAKEAEESLLAGDFENALRLGEKLRDSEYSDAFDLREWEELLEELGEVRSFVSKWLESPERPQDGII